MYEKRIVRWGILGPGNIARAFYAGALASQTGKITAIASRNPDPVKLSAAFPGVPIIPGYEAMLADPHIDAIYIATPHPFHARWAIAAAQHGKHVLCEKPMGMSEAEVTQMFAASSEAGTFLGEAFMYRQHPMTEQILDLIRAGRIGDVRMIRSSFGFDARSAGADHRLFSRELGGGGILDVGGYPVTMANLIVSCANGRDGAIPMTQMSTGYEGFTGVDECATTILRYPGGTIASLSCSISIAQDNTLHVMGTDGRLEVDEFWFGTGKAGGQKAIRLFAGDGIRSETIVTEGRNLYSFQFEAANAAIQAGKVEFSHPGLDSSESALTASILDKWLSQVSP